MSRASFPTSLRFVFVLWTELPRMRFTSGGQSERRETMLLYVFVDNICTSCMLFAASDTRFDTAHSSFPADSNAITPDPEVEFSMLRSNTHATTAAHTKGPHASCLSSTPHRCPQK
eukprot:TRINITY_DN26621_c0_g1_i1.p1 TRINITY_DN26621_c0_g1~~TRINITY_DN26621_c0_g1_i1.p1  ORF type:complete len:116 (-),score=2.68 TRINITY_DN26621_c0_g1_i1:182-529(-)